MSTVKSSLSKVCVYLLTLLLFAVALIDTTSATLPGARPHDRQDEYLDVYTFVNDAKTLTHFRATDSPSARISIKDLLGVIPDSAGVDTTVARYEFELPAKEFDAFTKLCHQYHKQDVVQKTMSMSKKSVRSAWVNSLARLR